MEKKFESFEDAAHTLERAVYEAAFRVLKQCEESGWNVGNWHRAAQTLAALAVEDLRIRWPEPAGVPKPSDSVPAVLIRSYAERILAKVSGPTRLPDQGPDEGPVASWEALGAHRPGP